MALVNVSSESVTQIPISRQADYNTWLAALAQHFPGSEGRIRGTLNAFVDQRIRQCGWTRRAEFCSSWIPGPDWQSGAGGGEYQPIFESLRLHYNNFPYDFVHTRAGWFFGLLLMDVMIHRDDEWEFRRESHDPVDGPEGLYYRPRV